MSEGDRDHRTARLTAAAAARTTSATARARRAITRLHNTGQPVTFVAVARAADVSTSFLYKHHQLRQEIDAKRGTAPAGTERSTAATAESLRTKLATAIDRNRELTEQLAQPRVEGGGGLARHRVVDRNRAALLDHLAGGVEPSDALETGTVEIALGLGDLLVELPGCL